MIINILDLINTIIQSVLLSYIAYYFIEKEDKKGYLKVVIVSIALFLGIYIGTIFLGNTTIGSLIIYIINIVIIAAFYKKNYKKAIMAYSLVYFCIQINSLICGTIYFGHIKDIVPIQYLNLSIIIFMYCPQFVMEYLILKYIDKVKSIYKDIIIRKYSVSIVLIINFSMQYIIAYVWIINGNDSQISKDMIIIALVVFLLIIVTHFTNMQKKINEISNLNKSLDLKINELNKIKHDYGAQISYLYGLHLMGKYERLGELLKGIINNNNSILDAVEITNNSDSIISIIARQAVAKGINVIVDEEVDLDEIIMAEIELQRVISNIVNNSITAMEGKGILTVKTYKRIDNIIITIQNNGPRIKDDVIDNIFNSGFSTKPDGEHGFGLAIVKEIVGKYKGTIKVKSRDAFTEFKISLPIKN